MRIVVALLLLLTACTASTPEPVRLKVLASPELANLGPVLDELRRATGVELAVEHRGTVEASRSLAGFDLAWLSTNRFLWLRGAEPALSSSIMTSPVGLGVDGSASNDNSVSHTSPGPIHNGNSIGTLVAAWSMPIGLAPSTRQVSGTSFGRCSLMLSR